MPQATPRVYLPRLDRLYQSLKSQPQRLEVDPALVKGILPEYGLELIKNPQTLLGGNRSYSLLVQTSGGKKILKQYKQSLKQPVIIYEHSILTHLAHLDFPAPRLVATTMGETLVQQGESRYALFDFIEGGFQYHNYVLLPGQPRQFITIAGELLARLHRALENFTPQGYNPDGFKSQVEERWRSLDWVLNNLAECVAKTSQLSGDAGQSRAAWLLPRAKYFEESLLQLDDRLNGVPLPRLIIHADYGPYNLLFQQDGPAVILDFEMARLDWRVTELIDAWYRFSHNRLGFQLNKMKWLLEAYQTCFPLTMAELRFVPLVWEYLSIWRCVVNWHYYCETQADSFLATCQRNLKMADWITANQAKLMATLCPK